MSRNHLPTANGQEAQDAISPTQQRFRVTETCAQTLLSLQVISAHPLWRGSIHPWHGQCSNLAIGYKLGSVAIFRTMTYTSLDSMPYRYLFPPTATGIIHI